MEERKLPHKWINHKHSGLSDAQEVHYSGDFRRADKAAQSVEKRSG